MKKLLPMTITLEGTKALHGMRINIFRNSWYPACRPGRGGIDRIVNSNSLDGGDVPCSSQLAGSAELRPTTNDTINATVQPPTN
jgi:hypothetical protein